MLWALVRARENEISNRQKHIFCAGDACPFRFCLLFWRPHTPGATRGTPGLLAIAAAAALLQVACGAKGRGSYRDLSTVHY